MPLNSQLTANDIILRIEAIFLNCVKHLNWWYFQINLNEAFTLKSSISADEAQEFLSNIVPEPNGTGFIYGNTPNNDYSKVLSILLYYLKKNPDILRHVIRRIFDSNEILNRSESEQGTMGLFNNKDRKDRNEKYKKKIRKNFREKESNIVVLAEGDSWFEFPKFRFLWNVIKTDVVKDIIDHLIDDERLAVYSIAAGGDWLSNMLKTGEYIQELPRVSPNVLLLSGGGNDLVGNRRLATMVRNPQMEGLRTLNIHEERTTNEELLIEMRKNAPDTSFNEARYRNGLSYIADEFFNFLNVTMVQYFLLFKNLIQLSEYKKMCIVTHGYDFSIPTAKRRGGFFHKFVNAQMDTGRWLFDALAGKGIMNQQDQKDVIYVMIYEFNEMLIQLAQFNEFENVYHIDCRGVAQDDDWYDELHLTSGKFGEVANSFKQCMLENYKILGKKKIYKVNE